MRHPASTYPPPAAPSWLGPGYAQPNAWPAATGPLPPPKRNPLRAVLLGLIGLTLLAIGGLVAANLLRQPAEVAYQNDDYQVPPPDQNPPPLPMPNSLAEAEQWVKDNPFYRTAMPTPVRCEVGRVVPATATEAELSTHFEQMTACLVRAYQPPASQAGFVVVRPKVTVFGERATSKCGTIDVNAAYCPADQQIYVSSKYVPQTLPSLLNNPWTLDITLAHEFGHAMQARTGILVASRMLQREMGSRSDQMDMSRRRENQADCFAGQFLRATSLSIGLTQADLPTLQQSYRARGADTVTGNPNIDSTHGRARSRLYWGETGLSTADVGRCNTFTADRELNR